MEPIAKTLLERFQVRKNARQKADFYNWLETLCKENGTSCRVESGGLLNSRNIVFGDPDTAEILLTAHYDTCARMPFPNLLFPRNILLTFLVQLGCLLPIFFIWGLLVAFALRWIGAPHFFAPIYAAGLVAFLLSIMIGPANPHTANDNTSGVVTALRIWFSLSEKQRAKTACVLFDHEELGLIGSAQFAKQHRHAAKKALVLNFDCVSDGDWMLFVAKPGAAKHTMFHALQKACETAATNGKQVRFYPTKTTFYPSDQMNFKRSIGIAAFHKKALGYRVGRIHTARDTVFDESNIDLLVTAVSNWIKQTEESA